MHSLLVAVVHHTAYSLTRHIFEPFPALVPFAVVAEIWQHTDPEHPSDEDDIIRLQDDFGRSSL